MKKEISKIVMVVGFLMALVGLLIWAVSDVEIDLSSVDEDFNISLAQLQEFLFPNLFAISNLCYIAMVLSVAFVFSKNDTVKNVGYGLSTLVGIKGILSLVTLNDIEKEVLENRAGITICFVGMIVIMASALLYFWGLCIDFFGFEKQSEASKKETTIDALMKYKAFREENVLTEEEFESIKEKLLKETSYSTKENCELDMLKKWKRLLDQHVITKDEFAEVKLSIFGK